jgi:hypothetical protein
MSVEDAKKAYGQLSKYVFSDVKSQGSNGRFKASKLERALKQIVREYSTAKDPEEAMNDPRDSACKRCAPKVPRIMLMLFNPVLCLP